MSYLKVTVLDAIDVVCWIVAYKTRTPSHLGRMATEKDDVVHHEFKNESDSDVS